MRCEPFGHTVKRHDFLIQLTSLELVIGQRTEILLVEHRNNLRAAFTIEIVEKSIADRRMVVQQAAEIALAGVQAELLGIRQILFGRVLCA
ncbi:hypothetical protein D3C85_1692620 [compost metagenome]